MCATAIFTALQPAIIFIDEVDALAPARQVGAATALLLLPAGECRWVCSYSLDATAAGECAATPCL